MSHTKQFKIAIIGSSLSGLITAEALSKQHHVSIFESTAQLGGAMMSDVCLSQKTQEANTLPLIFSPEIHPCFSATLAQLGLKTKPIRVTRSYHALESGLAYSNTFPFGVCTQPRQLITKRYTRMLREIICFHYRAKKDLQTRKCTHESLQTYLSGYTYSDMFVRTYLIPLALEALFGTATEILMLPAHTVLAILDTHGLLGFGHTAKYRTLTGGYPNYIQAITSRWRAICHINTPVLKVHRHLQCIEIETADQKHSFDYVIIAIAADRALSLIQNPTHNEQRLLSQWQYETGTHIQHTDKALLPQNKYLWGTRHCSHTKSTSEYGDYLTTYPLNALQKHSSKTDQFLSIYPENSPMPKPSQDSVIDTDTFRYPRLSTETLAAQPELPHLNGQERTFFCGAYFGNTPIESDVTSAIQVLHHFNCQI